VYALRGRQWGRESAERMGWESELGRNVIGMRRVEQMSARRGAVSSSLGLAGKT
jgi:hypothetical protein